MTADGPELRVRRATASDLNALVALEEASFDRPWLENALAGELAHPHARLWLAQTGPLVSGYTAFRLLPGEAELLRIAVRPASRRRHLGRRLLLHGLERLRAEGAQRCHLEVRPDNEPALLLYLHAGFTRGGERPGYYRDGRKALLLSKALSTA